MPTVKIKMLALCLTGQCNFACKYCYASELHSQNMTIEIARKAIDLAAKSGEVFILQLTGGEPLLNFSVLENAVNYVRQNKFSAIIRLQTNGSLLTNEMAIFLYKQQVGIGISLDGRPTINDSLRKTNSGSGATMATVRGIEVLKHNNIACGLTCVVTDNNVRCLDGIIEFAHFLGNVRRIGFDLLRGQGRGSSLQPPMANDIRAVMVKIHRKNQKLGEMTGCKIKLAQQERAQVQLLHGTQHTFGHCYAMNGEAAFVAPDGKIYACASFVGEQNFCIGNIWQGVDGKKSQTVQNNIQDAMQFCRDCKNFTLCGGGCYARWYGDGCKVAYEAECALKLSFV